MPPAGFPAGRVAVDDGVDDSVVLPVPVVDDAHPVTRTAASATMTKMLRILPLLLFMNVPPIVK
jgi:hypothetical protein